MDCNNLLADYVILHTRGIKSQEVEEAKKNILLKLEYLLKGER